MQREKRKYFFLTAIVATVLVNGAGGAFAFWSTAGAGTGTANVASLQAVSAVAFAGESPTSALVPGGEAADVVMKVHNPNLFDVSLVAVALAGPITADNGCGPTGVGLATATNLPLTVPSGTNVIHLAGAATMDQTSASACQGATFSIPVTLTVHR